MVNNGWGGGSTGVGARPGGSSEKGFYPRQGGSNPSPLAQLDYQVWSSILNEAGEPRLEKARSYLLPLTQSAVDLAVQVYDYWLHYDEYVLIHGSNRVTCEDLYLAVKCSKRGNDVYSYRLKERLGFLEKLPNYRFFNFKSFDRSVKTKMVWLTLTYDSKRCSLHQAWQNISHEWDLYLKNIRKQFGHIKVLRFYQAFPGGGEGKAKGYPHIHAVLLFEDQDFPAFAHIEYDDSGKIVVRYRMKEDRHLQVFKKHWHSFVDVQALSSVRAALNYCKKYAEGSFDGRAGNYKTMINCALTWLYRKRTFALSGGFQTAYRDLINADLHNSHQNLSQSTLDGDLLPVEPEWIWEFCGICPGSRLKDYGSGWVISLKLEDFDHLLNGPKHL